MRSPTARSAERQKRGPLRFARHPNRAGIVHAKAALHQRAFSCTGVWGSRLGSHDVLVATRLCPAAEIGSCRPGPDDGHLISDFDALDQSAADQGIRLSADGTVDLVLALQMIFLLDDLPAGLTRMARFTKPGGALLVVVADEQDGYTGHALRAFIAAGGDTGANQHHLDAIAERHRLLAPPEHGGGEILDELAHRLPSATFELLAALQPSRLYGHPLADMIALANVAVLSGIDGIDKFEAADRLLREQPELVDLRIEDEGPRKGMWSVTQPQRLAILRRRSE